MYGLGPLLASLLTRLTHEAARGYAICDKRKIKPLYFNVNFFSYTLAFNTGIKLLKDDKTLAKLASLERMRSNCKPDHVDLKLSLNLI